MGFETQSQYFIAKSEELDGQTLRVFYAPHGDEFIVPKEVLRAHGHGEFATQSLWNLITGRLPRGNVLPTTIEPSSVEDLGTSLDEFLRTQPANAVYIDEEAPDDIKQTLHQVRETLTGEAQATLADVLGLVMVPEKEDNRPFPGQYL